MGAGVGIADDDERAMEGGGSARGEVVGLAPGLPACEGEGAFGQGEAPESDTCEISER